MTTEPHDWQKAILAGFTDEQRARYTDLVVTFRDLGADDPEGWALSDVSEDIPQLARYQICRQCWRDVIDPARDRAETWIEHTIRDAARRPHAYFADAGAALARLLELGATVEDIGSICRLVSFESTFGVLNLIDDGRDPEAPDHLPGWSLMEIDQNWETTGRVIGALHEDILTSDPTGREGGPA